jgi:metal-dependent amidase/aminoacylase/carboxypeptidase family protein
MLILKLANLQALSLGGSCETVFQDGYEALINDNDLVDYIGKEVLGENNVVHKEYPSMGVEDFAYFSNRVPGAFYHLGCKKITPTYHYTIVILI